MQRLSLVAVFTIDLQETVPEPGIVERQHSAAIGAAVRQRPGHGIERAFLDLRAIAAHQAKNGAHSPAALPTVPRALTILRRFVGDRFVRFKLGQKGVHLGTAIGFLDLEFRH
jgi:hypothetical protein